MIEVLLILIACGASIVAGVVGVGGGLILIAFLPGMIPVAAIVPVHALVQIFSNSSRAILGWRSLQWEFLLPFTLGSIAGGFLSAQLTQRINLEYTPLIIATYILFNLWGPKQLFKNPPRGEFATIGLIQTFLSMIVGATGPMAQSTLVRKGLGRDAIIVTAATFMSLTHIIKIAFFIWLGFSFIDYWRIITGMSIGVIVGTYIGTHIRYKVPEQLFKHIMKWLLTVLAIRMVYLTLF